MTCPVCNKRPEPGEPFYPLSPTGPRLHVSCSQDGVGAVLLELSGQLSVALGHPSPIGLEQARRGELCVVEIEDAVAGIAQGVDRLREKTETVAGIAKKLRDRKDGAQAERRRVLLILKQCAELYLTDRFPEEMWPGSAAVAQSFCDAVVTKIEREDAAKHS